MFKQLVLLIVISLAKAIPANDNINRIDSLAPFI
jgi:hypothetical protein